jgi:alanine dehydrogenase
MLVGVPKEIKIHEYRVGMTPSSVRELIHHGHQVVVETNAAASASTTTAIAPWAPRFSARPRRSSRRPT